MTSSSKLPTLHIAAAKNVRVSIVEKYDASRGREVVCLDWTDPGNWVAPQREVETPLKLSRIFVRGLLHELAPERATCEWRDFRFW